MANRKFDIQLKDKNRNNLYPIAHTDTDGHIIGYLEVVLSYNSTSTLYEIDKTYAEIMNAYESGKYVYLVSHGALGGGYLTLVLPLVAIDGGVIIFEQLGTGHYRIVNVFTDDSVSVDTWDYSEDVYVRQSQTSANIDYPVILAASDGTTDERGIVRKTSTLKYNPSVKGLLVGHAVDVATTSDTVENFVRANSNSGTISITSVGNSSGNGKRGLWVGAHGTGSGKFALEVDTNNVVKVNGYSTGISASGGSAATFWRGDNTWSDTISGGLLSITNNSNTVSIGSRNSNWCHIYNSTNIPFIFNNTIAVLDSKDLGTSSYKFGNAYIGGTLTLSRTQDASGQADNKPALIIGGTSADAHIEIDANEIIAKSNGTTQSTLYLQDSGGAGIVDVNGTGGLSVSHGNLTVGDGKDLILKAASSASTDSGDIIFQNSSGTEIGRIYKVAGLNEFQVRYANNGTPYRIITTQNITYGTSDPSGGSSGDLYVKI